jgi:hypothetical protein
LAIYPICQNYDDEPFFSLWSGLCHQGNIYTASYAAVPVLVSLIENAPKIIDYHYFLLLILIHIVQLKGSAPAITDDLKLNYDDAIARLPVLAAGFDSWDELIVRVLSSALAVKSGNEALAEAI